MGEDVLRRHRKVRSAASNHGAAEAELPEPVQPDESNDSSGVRDRGRRASCSSDTRRAEDVMRCQTLRVARCLCCSVRGLAW